MPHFDIDIYYETESNDSRNYKIEADTKEEALAEAHNRLANNFPEGGAWNEYWEAREYTPYSSPLKF